jgi:hypothetical protein
MTNQTPPGTRKSSYNHPMISLRPTKHHQGPEKSDRFFLSAFDFIVLPHVGARIMLSEPSLLAFYLLGLITVFKIEGWAQVTIKNRYINTAKEIKYILEQNYLYAK